MSGQRLQRTLEVPARLLLLQVTQQDEEGNQGSSCVGPGMEWLARCQSTNE